MYIIVRVPMVMPNVAVVLANKLDRPCVGYPTIICVWAPDATRSSQNDNGYAATMHVAASLSIDRHFTTS